MFEGQSVRGKSVREVFEVKVFEGQYVRGAMCSRGNVFERQDVRRNKCSRDKVFEVPVDSFNNHNVYTTNRTIEYADVKHMKYHTKK